MPETSLSDTALNSITLSQVSPKDKPWDKHRANADKVAAYYAGSEFESYANRVYSCSEILDFRFNAVTPDGLLDLKLDAARFCRVRSCPVCQWRRSLMWKARAHKILPQVVADYPTHRWLFVTLTIRNCQITELRSTLTQMHKSFERMTKLKSFPAVGWLKSTEVTRGKDGSAHPHFHTLLMVQSGYFGKNYMKQTEWVQLWRRSLRIDYDPVVEVRAIKKGGNPVVLIPELLKYCTKESDLVADKEWFLELTRQMHNARVVSTGGLFKTYLKELEHEPEDLIGKNEDEELLVDDAEHLTFEWKRVDKLYRLSN
jgi:plasmid rolling circle replication initiator protein Rep